MWDIKLGENATLGDILESFQKRERNGKVQCRKRPGEWHPATSKSNEQMHADEARPAPSLINSAKLGCYAWPMEFGNGTPDATDLEKSGTYAMALGR
ncbi:unnamed protein product [Cercospora beticola]|nr:unnamed protein product [Cercospora beticola]